MRKIFKVYQPATGWTDCDRSIIGVAIVDNHLDIRKIKGANLHVAGFIKLLKEYLADFLKESAKYYRKNPIQKEVYKGVSGCQTFTLKYLEEVRCGHHTFRRLKRQEVLHISCNDKIEEVSCFLPDLILFLEDIEYSREDVDVIEIQELEEIDRKDFKYVYPPHTEEMVKKFIELA